MLIAIEGIDGAGKTTVSDRLVSTLKQLGTPARACRKNDISFNNTFADSRLGHLRETIWPSEGEPDEDLLGTHFYLYLLAAWFSATSTRLAPFAGNDKEMVVIDGSHYRVMAKAHQRAGLPMEFLYRLFDHVVKPDLVILLDLDPAIAWRRRSVFRETEIGRWDGFDGPPETAFCRYQSRIRYLLCQFAEENDWFVIRQDWEMCADDIIDQIVANLPISREQFMTKETG
ncbi:hypothetical protein [uncultured Roseibium sp.]|uniref:dTMP kinase n=1 Tax=uncultured Roseibium sp. TaxID=1936171 RepID=UPI00261EA859|nr:hypothetical protein [uncultured Roseibium sp.]